MDAGDVSLSERGGAVGEPSNGFPSALERLGLMAINRARSDPQTVTGPKSTPYPARPPVIWSLQLNQSSRFHATNLKLSDVTLIHTSACPLNADVATSGCDGDPSCACASPTPADCAMCAKVSDPINNDCGTSWDMRIGYFVSGSTIQATGEVAAAGYADPMKTVDGWMDEAAGSDGHRMNLTDQGVTSNTMGYGHASGTPACFNTFDVSDSGNIKNATIPKIPTAAVSPASGNAGTFTFYATWADPSHGAPESLNVVLDGSCLPMTLELGTDTLNATYKATSTLAAGCHQYWVSATDSTGAAVAYPTKGMFTIPVGGSSACSSDYVTTAIGSCSADGGIISGTGGTAGGSTGGNSGAGGRPTGTGGAAGAHATGGAAGHGPGGAPGTGGPVSTETGGVTGTGGIASGTGGNTLGGTGGGSGRGSGSSGGCSCDIDGGRAPGRGLVLLSLVLPLLVGARRPPVRRKATNLAG
ncbi:MAG TPA: hypothetical protein VMT03_22545 [Polyangia bacterium]|nr:hypothetical protein [Polyangia bacterium]